MYIEGEGFGTRIICNGVKEDRGRVQSRAKRENARPHWLSWGGLDWARLGSQSRAIWYRWPQLAQREDNSRQLPWWWLMIWMLVHPRPKWVTLRRTWWWLMPENPARSRSLHCLASIRRCWLLIKLLNNWLCGCQWSKIITNFERHILYRTSRYARRGFDRLWPTIFYVDTSFKREPVHYGTLGSRHKVHLLIYMRYN